MINHRYFVRQMGRRIFLSLFLLTAFFSCLPDVSLAEGAFDGYALFAKLSKEQASKKARAMAENDFAHGVYRVWVYGLRRDESPDEKYLRKKYGVTVTPIAGCVVSDGILGAADGYNSTMESLLKQKFGRDIFKEAEKISGE